MCCAPAARSQTRELPRRLEVVEAANSEAYFTDSYVPAAPDSSSGAPPPGWFGAPPGPAALTGEIAPCPPGGPPGCGPFGSDFLAAPNWSWQVLPEGVLYHQYLADVRASRLSSSFVWEQDQGWLWDIGLGGHIALVRFGDRGESGRVQGWEWQVEGAGFPRLDFENDLDLLASDFRAGTWLAWSRRRLQARFGYYHLSSHAGDELLLRDPAFVRINYVRDQVGVGLAYFLTDDLRLYSDAGYAFYTSGGAQPIELQFGVEFSPAFPTGPLPVPFLAVHGNLREELDFGGYLVVQAGAQWRGALPGNHRMRIGLEYFNGKSRQYEFFREFEQQVGLGLWYDF